MKWATFQLAVMTSALLAASVCMVACSSDDEPEAVEETADSATAPPSSTLERGPVTLTVSASEASVDVGQPFFITIEVEAEMGVEVTMPTFEDSMGPFAIQDARTGPGVPDAVRRRWSHIYTVDTFDAGEIDVPAVTIAFVDARGVDEDNPDAAPVEAEVSSEAFAVTVRSSLPEDNENMEQRDIRGLAAIPLAADAEDAAEDEASQTWLTALIVVGAIAAIVIAYLLLRRRGGAPPEPDLPAHEWAMRELDRLAADRLIEHNQLEPFYTRLSLIVRSYIERRFGIMAPERTTDEFLREAGRDRALSESQRDVLATFLRSADMVKFALYEPQAGEGDAAFDDARSFVKQTTPPEAKKNPDEADGPSEHAGAAA